MKLSKSWDRLWYRWGIVGAAAFLAISPCAESQNVRGGRGQITVPEALFGGGGAGGLFDWYLGVGVSALTNSVYLQLQQAAKEDNLSQIVELVPKIEALMPDDPRAFIQILSKAMGWATAQSPNYTERARVNAAIDAMISRSQGDHIPSPDTDTPSPRELQLWRIRTNMLLTALHKPWPTNGSPFTGRYYLATMGVFVKSSVASAPEAWVRPLLVPVASYAGNLRSNMIPLTGMTSGIAGVRNGRSLHDDYLTAVAWGTNSIRQGDEGFERTRDALDSAAVAQLLLKREDPVALSTARALLRGHTAALSQIESQEWSRVNTMQQGLREADGYIVERMLIPYLAKIPPTNAENREILEKAATAASLVPEERQKVGLK